MAFTACIKKQWLRFSMAGVLLGASVINTAAIAQQDFITDHSQAAQAYMQSKQWDYANFEWRAVLNQDPGNTLAVIGLATSLKLSGMIQEAVKTLETASLQHPNWSIDIALADLYKELAEFDQSKVLYQQVLKTQPTNLYAFKGLQSLLPILKEPDKSDVTKQLTDNKIMAEAQISILMRQGYYEKALPSYDIAFAYSQEPAWLNDKALALLLTGRFPEAANELSRLNGKYTDWHITANYAVALLAIGQYYDAQKQMETALSLCKDESAKAKLYNDLGYIYEMGKKRSKARFAYERALALNPKLRKASQNLGYIYQREREFVDAVAHYQNVIHEDPKNAEAYNQLGFTYEMMHKPKEALLSYKKALSLDPKNKTVYFNMGSLYKKMNRMPDAVASFKKMSDLEFQEIESRPTKLDPEKSELFSLIDLFFASPFEEDRKGAPKKG